MGADYLGGQFTAACLRVGTSSFADFIATSAPALLPGATGPGVWITGRPHLVLLPGGAPRLAADTLIWQRNKLTVRLEGATTLQQAVTIAESLR